MWAYISHYIFIVLSANYIVRTMNLSYIPALLSNIFFSEIMILVTYAMINKVQSLMPKKEDQNKKVTEMKDSKFSPGGTKKSGKKKKSIKESIKEFSNGNKAPKKSIATD